MCRTTNQSVKEEVLAERLDREHYHLSTKVEVSQAPAKDEELAERIGPLVTELMREFTDILKTVGGKNSQGANALVQKMMNLRKLVTQGSLGQ